jgi:hypothetical protein
MTDISCPKKSPFLLHQPPLLENKRDIQFLRGSGGEDRISIFVIPQSDVREEDPGV